MKQSLTLILLVLVAAVGLISDVGHPPAAFAAPPTNDNFANAVSISLPAYPAVVATADNIDATTEAGEPAPCATSLATVWYTWTSPGTGGFVSFDTHGSAFDTVIAAYTGPNVASLANVACADNQSGSDTRAAVGFLYAPNTTYHIQVGSKLGFTGPLVLSMGPGHNISVSSSTDNTNADAVLTLREAILLARGGTTPSGLNRPLAAGEGNFITGTPFALVPDQVTFDMIHLRHDLANITLASALPAMDAVGDVASGLGSTSVVLGGNLHNCFSLSGTFNAVEAMRATNCVPGVLITGDNNHVRGNTLSAGSLGVDINAGAANNIVGGASVPERNVITGNGSGGVRIVGAGAEGNVVSGNYVGVLADGVTAAGNGGTAGVNVATGAQANVIGGENPGERNVIAANTGAGVYIDSSNANIIHGNYIGLAADGFTATPNNQGVRLTNASTGNQVGGSTAGDRNVIAGNTNEDIVVDHENADGNMIYGNYIGVAADGSTTVPSPTGVSMGVSIANGADNSLIGCCLIGGGNVISGYSAGTCSCGINVAGGAATTGTVISGNKIGTDATGMIGRPNFNGIAFNANSSVIGGATPDQRNIISGNSFFALNSTGGSNNLIIGNYMGVGADGTTAVPNANGIIFSGASSTNQVGGDQPGYRNVISANLGVGIVIQGEAADSNAVYGNYIGVGADGVADLGNEHGIHIDAGADNNFIGEPGGNSNVISGNNSSTFSAGVLITGVGTTVNRVHGNLIGVGANGLTAVPNVEGVHIVGPGQQNTSIFANTISGNEDTAVWINGSHGNTVATNNLGTDASGMTAVPNSVGVWIDENSDANTIGGIAGSTGNLISGNAHGVVFIQASGTNYARGNLIGPNAAGTATIGNGSVGISISNTGGSVQVGGPAVSDRNVISGTAFGPGVFVNGPSASVTGNYIGTSRDGMSALPNVDGVRVFPSGGGATLSRNLVSGNSGWGFHFSTSGSTPTLAGNWVGTDATYFGALGNGAGGIRNGQSNNAVLSTSDVNTIAHNGGPGIEVDGATTTQTIQRQSIHSNGGLGIDLTNGGNSNRAAPTIGGVSGSTVSGFACPSCTVDVYSDSAGEGRFYHATATANAIGQWSTTIVQVAEEITATATDASGNTSEFSAPFFNAEPCDGVDNDGDGQTDEGNPNTDLDAQANCIDADDDNDTHPDASDGCVLLAEDVDGFDDIDGCPDSDNDLDGVCDPGQVSIACSGSDNGYSAFHPAAHGHNPPLINCANVPEDYDAFHDEDGCPEPDNDNDGRPDTIDTCPGDDNHTGPDGALGAPQDLNHNGIKDGSELPFTTDDSVLVFEDYDGVLDSDGCHDSPGDDFDGDGLTDDSEVFQHLTLAFDPDSDADGVVDGPDNCKLWPNPSQALPNWSVPANDSDCDRFTNAIETYLGTDPTRQCPANTGTNNEPVDNWPPDLNDNRIANTLDAGQFVFTLNQSNPNHPGPSTNPSFNKRHDFNGNGIINTLDVGAYVFVLNKTCSEGGP